MKLKMILNIAMIVIMAIGLIGLFFPVLDMQEYAEYVKTVCLVIIPGMIAYLTGSSIKRITTKDNEIEMKDEK